MKITVKICGLSTPEAVRAAISGGADMVGFVFFPPSPRAITPEKASDLAALVPDGVLKVALVVDASDALLARIMAALRPDILQLHGDETPARVAQVRRLTGIQVMKAVALSGPDDLERARAYEEVADRFLFDAKPPKGATRPGGNALAFDWELLAGTTWTKPWLLAGGLDADNLAEAVRTSGAVAVDVSSGVEDAPGKKSPDKIRAFLKGARKL